MTKKNAFDQGGAGSGHADDEDHARRLAVLATLGAGRIILRDLRVDPLLGLHRVIYATDQRPRAAIMFESDRMIARKFLDPLPRPVAVMFRHDPEAKAARAALMGATA
ncbi:hypothetical protein [Paracoccus sp. (in: a-proteobacteria)]|jgi:hypothetical protein|uniref:hypothetical protein n=1 Tax=Paracoccus sp. TaxID=267 RepID=UPI0035AF0C24